MNFKKYEKGIYIFLCILNGLISIIQLTLYFALNRKLEILFLIGVIFLTIFLMLLFSYILYKWEEKR